jgi:hypothetical protein
VDAIQKLKSSNLLWCLIVLDLMLSEQHPPVEDNLGDSTNDSVDVLLNHFLFGLKLFLLLIDRESCFLLQTI